MSFEEENIHSANLDLLTDLHHENNSPLLNENNNVDAVENNSWLVNENDRTESDENNDLRFHENNSTQQHENNLEFLELRTPRRKDTRNMRIVQINLHRSATAQAVLCATAHERNIDIALVQEPYVGRDETVTQAGTAKIFQKKRGSRVKAAIFIFSSTVHAIMLDGMSNSNIVCITLAGSRHDNINIASFYFEPHPTDPTGNH